MVPKRAILVLEEIMTIVYFIRHAQPDHTWIADDCTRPLTLEGQQDSKIVYEFLKEFKFVH
jgi:2,3-bisphosphoglycerate-dependent phosphoglycerate mutase